MTEHNMHEEDFDGVDHAENPDCVDPQGPTCPPPAVHLATTPSEWLLHEFDRQAADPAQTYREHTWVRDMIQIVDQEPSQEQALKVAYRWRPGVPHIYDTAPVSAAS